MTITDVPRYRDLPQIPELGAPHSWDVFGRNDELGRINLLTEDVVREAAKEVRRGTIFNLALPLNQPDPPWGGRRTPYVHIIDEGKGGQDDRLDNFYLQGSSQWDALRHIRAREFGFYGGRQSDTAGPNGTALGIDKWAEHGMVGRGVLIDVARFLEAEDKPLDPRGDAAIDVDLLQRVLARQQVALRTGDMILLRTGYVGAFLAASRSDRIAMSAERRTPGLEGSRAMAEFLWDSGVVAIGADNPAVENVPGSAAVGSLHRRLIPLLGFALGELFALDALAEDCAVDGRYTCCLVAAPLNLPGGVGSPANTIAIK